MKRWKTQLLQIVPNLHLHQHLSFEPNFDSFRLDERFVKIEAKQSRNRSVVLKQRLKTYVCQWCIRISDEHLDVSTPLFSSLKAIEVNHHCQRLRIRRCRPWLLPSSF